MKVYITPYKEAVQWAGKNLSDAAFKTWQMIFTHIDDIALCFPGFRRLAELGDHDLNCIWIEMQEIMSRDLVREIEPARRDEVGRWTPALYQINPYTVHLRTARLDAALKYWHSVEQTIEQKVPVWIPRSNFAESAESAPTGNAKKQQQESTPVNSSSSRTPISFKAEMQNANAGEIAAWQRAQQRAAQHSSAQRQTTKTDVPPRGYPEITPVPRKLSMSHEEELAQTVALGVNMTIRLARGLITMYGYNAVLTAHNDSFVINAINPAGALRSLLQKQQRVEPVEVVSDEWLDYPPQQTSEIAI